MTRLMLIDCSVPTPGAGADALAPAADVLVPVAAAGAGEVGVVAGAEAVGVVGAALATTAGACGGLGSDRRGRGRQGDEIDPGGVRRPRQVADQRRQAGVVRQLYAELRQLSL